jgi:hypothetical protein
MISNRASMEHAIREEAFRSRRSQLRAAERLNLGLRSQRVNDETHTERQVLVRWNNLCAFLVLVLANGKRNVIEDPQRRPRPRIGDRRACVLAGIPAIAEIKVISDERAIPRTTRAIAIVPLNLKPTTMMASEARKHNSRARVH